MAAAKKSRTFAVLTRVGPGYRIHFLAKRTIGEATDLDHRIENVGWVSQSEENLLIRLLVTAGLTVRYYDAGEKLWRDNSLMYGPTVAPGSRDGTWGVPDLENFEKDYLTTM